jgi:hypothetical protein
LPTIRFFFHISGRSGYSRMDSASMKNQP